MYVDLDSCRPAQWTALTEEDRPTLTGSRMLPLSPAQPRTPATPPPLATGKSDTLVSVHWGSGLRNDSVSSNTLSMGQITGYVVKVLPPILLVPPDILLYLSPQTDIIAPSDPK